MATKPTNSSTQSRAPQPSQVREQANVNPSPTYQKPATPQSPPKTGKNG